MNADQFYRDHADRIPVKRRAYYYMLERLAEAGTLPLGAATQHDGKWRFDLPNPTREPEQVEAIILLIEQAARPKAV